MASDEVKADPKDIRALRRGVSSYAQHMRDAVDDARKEVEAARRETEAKTDERRNALRAAESELFNAEKRLANCEDENCAGLRAEAEAARLRKKEAKAEFERAQAALSLVEGAQSDLMRSLKDAEGVAAETGSVSSNALAHLESRLGEVGRVSGFVLGTLAAAEILGAASDLGRLGANTAQAFGVDTPFADQNLAQMVESNRAQEVGHMGGELWKDGRPKLKKEES